MIAITPFIYRGKRPNTASDYDQLKDAGFAAVLSVEWGVKDLIDGTPDYQKKSCASRGMRSFSIPMNDITPPTPTKIALALSVLQSYQINGNKILLHCEAGVDRTGVVALCYRVTQMGWTYEQAYAEWVKLGRHWWYDWWKFSIRRYLGA